MPIRVRSTRRPASATPPGRPSASSGLPFGLPVPPPGWKQKPEGISLCMIVRDEERFLAQCLRSAQDSVDEIVIVDTGSTDRTVEIARGFGATVLHHAWRNDFAWARNRSIEGATRRWILFLDADEELLPQSRPALAAIRTAPAYQNGIWVRCRNRSDDYLGTGEMSHALIRIFPNHPEIRFKGMIHEFPTIGGRPNGLDAQVAPIEILHHGYVKEMVSGRDKAARNLAILKEASEREPDDAYHHFNLGTTYFLMGDYPAARDAFERMLALVGDERRGFLANGLAILAENYTDKLGDAVRGEAVARRALGVAPHYANAHFQLGKALSAQGRYEDARAAYLAAIDDGRYAKEQFVVDDQVYRWKAHSEVGSTYVMEKDDERALEWFERGIANAPKAEPLHVNRAKALERLGRRDEALAAYRHVYELHGSQMATLEYLNALLRAGREREALEIVEARHEGFEPDKMVAMLMAGAAIAQRTGRLDDERYLRAAAAIAPGAAEVLDPLEAILRARGKAAELPALIAREDATPPRSAADYRRRVFRAIGTERFADALALAEAGLALDGADARLRYAAAIALARLERAPEALDHLGAIASADRVTAVNAELLRATLLRRLGMRDEALAALQRGLALDSRNVDALLLRADLLESTDPSGAEAALREVCAIDCKRGGVALSTYLLRIGRFDEAARAADAALREG